MHFMRMVFLQAELLNIFNKFIPNQEAGNENLNSEQKKSYDQAFEPCRNVAFLEHFRARRRVGSC